jgi:hypothetical protein
MVLFEHCTRKKSTAMGRFKSLFPHTTTCGKGWRQKRRNMWVRPTNMKRPEFGIFSAFLGQLVSKRWLCSLCFYVHRGRGIADCLVVLNCKNLPFQRQVAATAYDHRGRGIADCLVVLNCKNLLFQRQVAATAYDHRNPTDEHATCRLNT